MKRLPVCDITASSKVSALKARIDWHQGEVVTVKGHGSLRGSGSNACELLPIEKEVGTCSFISLTLFIYLQHFLFNKI